MSSETLQAIVRRATVAALACGWMVLTGVSQAAAELWVLVDTAAETLTVMDGERPLEVFRDIALGRKGAGRKRWRGDDTTPLGVFRVGWMNPHSRFSLFIGLDYPNLEYAEQAYRENRIDVRTYYAIRHAILEGRTPPQDTLLGGSIGIHGLGGADPWFHASFNWTQGCIALTNGQIWRLAQWVQQGTRVEIR